MHHLLRSRSHLPSRGSWQSQGLHLFLWSVEIEVHSVSKAPLMANIEIATSRNPHTSSISLQPGSQTHGSWSGDQREHRSPHPREPVFLFLVSPLKTTPSLAL